MTPEREQGCQWCENVTRKGGDIGCVFNPHNSELPLGCDIAEWLCHTHRPFTTSGCPGFLRSLVIGGNPSRNWRLVT